jgi:CPA1 family monovalent cation:H+ antiporter
VLRLVWVFFARYLLVRPGPDPTTGQVPPASFTFLLGWAGMRGVVTLAAAFVIPVDAPYREVLLLIAFTVVAGTSIGSPAESHAVRVTLPLCIPTCCTHPPIT